ncbi:protein phosphatase 2C-like domain-containing protein 1 [Montipora foliosa]|uniref:protein phosphatase 2C-like domain-containing protein 1 n=1 Tax=Montipora foliosa TaxID=591990 RepID=UPI0035F10CD7
MAGSPNSHRSKYGMVQASRSVLRWFSLSEEPQETRSRTATVTQRRSKTLHSQRKASKTKRKFPTRGVRNVVSEKRKGLEPREPSDMEHAAVTVNLISEKRTSSDEEMEFGEHIEGEEGDAEGYEENDDDDDGQSDVGTSDLLTETSSVITEEQILLPNIVIPCSKCGEVINICRLQGHRNLHSALKVFKYSHHQRPKDLNTLVRRRRTLIQQHRDQVSSSDHEQFFGYKHLHKINTAFEVLRSELNRNMGLPSLNDQNIKEIQVIGRGFDLSCTMAAGVCEEANKRWKSMEDVHVYKNEFLNHLDSSFFAIYDGYSGKNTALKCSRHLHVFLKEELDSIITHEQVKPTKNQIAAAFRNAFCKTEENLLLTSQEERSQSRWSGCSAVTCVLSRDACLAANVGNVGALLLRDDDVAKVLTHKHDLYNKKERNRVKNSSGIIVKTERCALVNGALGVTRGLGSIGDTALKKCVINEPDVKNVRIESSDQLIIVASGGFWKVFSFEETVHLVNGFIGQIRRDVKRQIMRGTKQNRRKAFEEEQKDLTDRSSGLKFDLKVVGEADDTSNFGVTTGYFAANKTELRRWKSESEVSFDKFSPFHKKANNELVTKTQDDVETEHVDETTNSRNNDVIDGVSIEYLRCRRSSLPDDKTLRSMKDSGGRELTKEERARLLAKSLSERLVKCALYAESMDNITVFVALLPGFSMINWQMVTADILEALDAQFAEDGELS